MYKVTIKDVSPPTEPSDLSAYHKCLLGVSVSDPLYQNIDKLKCLFEWLSSKFDNTQIIIGDYLNRINETIFFGTGEQESIAKSLYVGELLHSQIESEIIKYPKGKFALIHWKDFLDKRPRHKILVENLRLDFRKNEKFRRSVENSASFFVDKSARTKGMYLDKELARKKSIDYILEELAVFSLLIDDDYKVQVYPGTTLKVLKELANDQHDGIETNLTKGIYLDLTIKKR